MQSLFNFKLYIGGISINSSLSFFRKGVRLYAQFSHARFPAILVMQKQ